ncbi:hypothetical protein DBR37_02635 [Herminiimonas sp. KBW02]|uniref:lysozyme inhibitor LprI family protein n=1 Tax=Herminiimonas sp. KBW02 TaxID=2153363 RepID=UPI000F5A7CB8|nr:lysozyme inhibitor LprI family protein [Herminiimonas sp. KBW02]RQO37104.1 hypothetical protein DBR37_02635 [Herminiimonas sp. KBW02]
MKMPHVLAGLLLVISGAAAAQDQALLQEALKDCDKNQLTMNVCASHRYTAADQILNQQYKKLMAQQDATGKQRLRDAQRAWIGFRDKDCLANTGLREESGSIWPLLHFSCLERHTVQRSEDLKVQACGMEGCAR